MPKKIRRRRRGRPPRDYSNDPDLAVAELAIALQAAWDLSERKAIDLALARGGEPGQHSKVPRGSGKPGRARGLLVGYALPARKSFKSQARNIRRKLKDGKLHPRTEAVLYLAKLLHLLRSYRR